MFGPLTRQQTEKLLAAEMIDISVERMLAAAQLPVHIGPARSVADYFHAYLCVRLQRADNPMPLTDMERMYVRHTKLSLALELWRLNLDGYHVLAQMAVCAVETVQ